MNLTNEQELKQEISMLECFNQAKKRLAPSWDIRDCVAVNPFFGLREKNFLEVAQYMEDISGNSILPNKEFYLKKYNSGEINEYDLEISIQLYLKECPQADDAEFQLNPSDLINFIKNTHSDPSSASISSINCISDFYDKKNQCSTTQIITNEISKWAAAYFDEGQALWKIPTEDLRFYSWWKSLAIYDRPFRKQNKEIDDNFINIIKMLPDTPEEALDFLCNQLLKKIQLNAVELSDYFYKLIYTVLGWSSYIQKFEFEASRSGDTASLRKIGGVIDIISVRMVYDIALLIETTIDLQKNKNKLNSNFELDYNYIWLNAAEASYRRNTKDLIIQNSKKDKVLEKDTQIAQMIFCIDVRSEIIRRHLEQLSRKIQTIGFAGFFGMPISLKEFGHHASDQNCPVLLNTNCEIDEIADNNKMENILIKKKNNFVQKEYFKKIIQTSANSGFSFVETFGLSYIGKIITSGLGKTKPNINISAMGLSEEEKKHIQVNTQKIDFEKKVSMAMGALKNMGLTKNFAKYVFFIGHGSESSNNPYASALDCGACAGHNGHSNAKVLCSILNMPDVRDEISKKGITIPENTVFLSGWHNTTKDEIIINAPEKIEKEQSNELDSLYKIFNEACENCREERAVKIPGCDNLNKKELTGELNQRANNWSEIRPEWGLSRNASFIVAPRELTRNLNLNGRSFLHDYDQSEDDDLKKLELIMTAPMIVTNWINMQYYASTVNPQKFGAGNKVLNNVTSGIGCIQGNESDLLNGLAEQSVWYKGKYFHEPIRLQVFIQADIDCINKIIEKHQLVKELIFNNWLKVISINPKTKDFLLFQSNEWIEMKDKLLN